MNIETFPIAGVICFVEATYTDHRGSFTETFNEERLNTVLGKPTHFCQDNFVTSKKNVLRGLHYQTCPHAQGKLVRCLKGSILDVFVDLRFSSPTFLKACSVVLTERNNKVVWIPPGLAHGYLSLLDDTCVMYKVTAPYVPKAQRTLAWNDPELQLFWSVDPVNVITSQKDANYDYTVKTLLANCDYFA